MLQQKVTPSWCGCPRRQISADAPGGIAKKGDDIRIPHAYIIRYNADGKISTSIVIGTTQSINSIKASAL